MKRIYGFRNCVYLLLGIICSISPAFPSIFGTVRGIVHDAQHRPISGAHLQLQAKHSDWKREAFTDDEGKFQLDTVPAGDYTVTISHDGFREYSADLLVAADSAPLRHFPLELAGVNEKVEVSENTQTVDSTSSVSPTTLSRETIASTPGATRTDSLDLITDYTPGAYMVHDQLHVRGGHQVSWLIDGIPVPNTNIASNVGPQFDPKDMDYLEVQRGSYEASEGDRTYGVFNVLPRTGFERNRQAELVLSAGNFYQTNDTLSFGSHTERFAYYASLNANRSNLGLETPVAQVIHDAENGYGGFGSFIFNANPSNQLRLVMSARRDYYQIPNDSFSSQVHDGQHEADAFANFSCGDYRSSFLGIRRRPSRIQRELCPEQSSHRRLRLRTTRQSVASGNSTS